MVVHTAGGEVLRLLRRSPPDFWQSVTGSLAPGESPQQAALREVREETGLDASAGLTDTGVVNRYPIHPAWRSRYAPDVSENTEYVFRLLLPETAPIRLAPAEHSEYQWLPREAAAVLAASDTDRKAILALAHMPSASA